MITIFLLSALIVATSYVGLEYSRRLKKTQTEYERAKGLVEDIILSFNRELKRKSEKLEEINYEVEDVKIKAEAGIRKGETFERKILPLENLASKLSVQYEEINSIVQSIEKINNDALKKLLNIDIETIETKLDSIEASQKTIKDLGIEISNFEASQDNLLAKITGLEEELQKVKLASELKVEASLPVMPIKRDKAMAALTDTEIAVLEFLTLDGPKTAPEIRDKVQLSREHTARLMKKLYEEGYLERETRKLPFTYSVKKEMEKLLKKPENIQP
jgi:predicted HTH transcriptional regulator